MARVKNKRKTAEDKIDMTLDEIIKLQKSEKKKQLKAKKQTSVKKPLQPRKKVGRNITSLKSPSARNRLKKGKQQPGQQKLSVQRQRATNQFTERNNNKKKQDNNYHTFSKVKPKGNKTPRNTIKSQYSKKARENLVNSRRQLQTQQRVNKTRQWNNKGKQNPKWTRQFTSIEKQSTQDKNQGGNPQGRRSLRRSFEERLLLATENASKLKVIIDNPKAKLSSASVSARDLIEMQLSRISGVTGNTALSIPERPQQTAPSKDHLDFKLNPTQLHHLKISLNSDLVQLSSNTARQSFPFNNESRISIPVETAIVTLNERFSAMPVHKDEYNLTLQGRSIAVPIVVD